MLNEDQGRGAAVDLVVGHRVEAEGRAGAVGMEAATAAAEAAAVQAAACT